ncbi:MAG: rod shape-determining protein MreC [Planktomarina sp.]
MAREPKLDQSLSSVGRLILGIMVFLLVGLFFVWRIDSPRVERLRMEVIDSVMPSFAWAAKPVDFVGDLVGSARNYARIYQQNQDLRRELQQLKAWREAALQLEQENARLLDLNNVRLDPKFTHVTGVVLADSGSPFRQTVLLNVGQRDGIVDGWATMDGLGVVGRIAGVGGSTSRVILLTDDASRVAITLEPSGQKALLVGDNTGRPPIEFLENPDVVRPGDRVVTSGDGGVFPPGLLVGQVAADPSGRLRVRLSADLSRLEFLRVIRHRPKETIGMVGSLVGVPALPPGPVADDGL